jgi:hypothetical protein
LEGTTCKAEQRKVRITVHFLSRSGWGRISNEKIAKRYSKERLELLDHLKLGETHLHTLESWKALIELYEAWNKPDEAKKWRAKLPKTKA